MSIKTRINGEWVVQSGGGGVYIPENQENLSYYELDLTSSVTVENNSTETQTFDVTSVIDGATLADVVNAGQIVRVHFLMHYDTPILGDILTFTEFVVLDAMRTHSNDISLSSVYFRNDAGSSNVRLDIMVDAEGVYTVTLVYSPDPVKAYVDEALEGSAIEVDATLSIEGQAADAAKVGEELNNRVRSVNGNLPDADGNVNVELDLIETTSLDFTNWSDGSFVETLSDGSTVTHTVVFDTSGYITNIDGISIIGAI